MSITGFIRAQRWLAHAVALIVLALSAVPAIARMQCLESGHETYTVGDRFDCCVDEHPEGTTVFRATCCEVDVTDPHKADHLPQPTLVLCTMILEQAPTNLLFDGTGRGGTPYRPEAARSPLPLDLRLSCMGSFLL